MQTDLTISEALADPLIELMLKADGLNRDALAHLLDQAAHHQLEQKMSLLREERAAHFYQRLSAYQAAEQVCSHC